MRSSTLSAAAALLGAASFVNAQTFTSCDPLNTTCPADEGLGKTITTDFTKGITDDWTTLAGTTMTYDKSLGAVFTMKVPTDAPVVESNKYIMFGKITAVLRAAPGTGTVSSFILESDDLDEIDWEWLGANDGSVESNFFGKGDTTTYDRAQYHNVATPIDGFHTYVIDWTSDRIIWSIDGNAVRQLNYGDALAHAGARYPQTPMRVRMGNWPGCLDASNTATQGTCQWAGGQIDYTKGPFNMYVQSVTVEDYGCGGNYTYSDNSGSFQSIKSSGVCGSSGTSDSSSSSSASSSSTASSTASSTSGSASTTSSTASATGVSNSTSTSTSTSTLSTVKSSATGKGSGTATTTGATATSTSSGASSLKPIGQSGVFNLAVVAVGLGLGFMIL